MNGSEDQGRDGDRGQHRPLKAVDLPLEAADLALKVGFKSVDSPLQTGDVRLGGQVLVDGLKCRYSLFNWYRSQDLGR